MSPSMTARVALVVCAMGLSACGSSGAHGYHNPKYPYGAPNLAISMSKCMRANGVPSFPDPKEGPNGGGVGWVGGLFVTAAGGMVVEGVSLGGPALKHALSVCREYMPSGSPPPQESEGQRVQAIADARCMRENGVPDFPDPTFSGGNESLNLPSGVNSASPSFQAAARRCGLLKP